MTAQGPDELRAVHAARRELGPDYDDALLGSFVDRAEAQLRRRLDNDRPVAQGGPAPTREHVHVTLGPGGLTLVAVNGGWGVLSSLILNETYPTHLLLLVVIWMVVAVADAAYAGALIARRADERRKRAAAPPDRARRAVPRPGTGHPTST